MKQTIVIVLDDEPCILHSLGRLLKNELYNVFLTTNYKESLKVMEKEKIKVVIADLKMPEISGLDFLNIIKQKYPYVIRMVLTGYVNEEVAKDALLNGLKCRFINKPWNDQQLKSIIIEGIKEFDDQQKTKYERIV